MFENIDGVASNFDLFSTKIISATNKISFLTIYQSKLNGKSKGSGLAIYVKDDFIYSESVEFNQCSPNLESLFIKVTNTNEPTFVGVIYRPPSADKDSSISELNELL